MDEGERNLQVIVKLEDCDTGQVEKYTWSSTSPPGGPECTEEDQGERNHEVVVKMEDFDTGQVEKYTCSSISTTRDVVTSPPGGLEFRCDGKVAGNPSGTEIYGSSADLNSAPSWRTVSDMPPVYNQADNGTGYLSLIPVCKEESSPTLVQVKLEPEEQQEERLQRPHKADRFTLTSYRLRPTYGSGYIRRMEYAEFPLRPVCPTEHEERTSSPVRREPEPPQIPQEQEEEPLQRAEEAAGSSLTLAVETEEDDESREREPVASTSAEHPMESDENMDDESASNKPNSQKTQNVEGQRLSARSELSQGQRSSKQTPSTRSGTGKKCFTCTECGKVFGRPSLLKQHRRTVCVQATVCNSLKSKAVRRHRTDGGKTCSPHLSGVKSKVPKVMRRCSYEEEEETDDDEEWTPSLSGDKVIEVRSGNRTLRKRDDISYTEPEVPEDDNFYFCDQCREFFLKECDKHGLPVFISDSIVALPLTDRARLTLPSGFTIKQSGIPNAGLGVFNSELSKLAAGTHFGSYEGVKAGKEDAVESGYSWVIRRKRGHYDYIDAKDETRSNWMRYVNCARNETEHNLIAFQHRGQVLYRCCRPVARGEELLVWYGDEYARELGIVFDELWDNKCSSATGERSSSSQTQVFSCSECPYAFSSQLFLHKHIKRSHNDLYCQMVRNGQIPPTACQPISSSVTSQKQGDTNKPRPYSQKQFTCKLCDKSFNMLGNLKRHMRIHTGEKPYACKLCAKSFNVSSILKSHMRIHTGEKPYTCNTCYKSFSVLGALKAHHVVHTGEKPYACKLCDKSFSQPGNLKIHQVVHTGEKPYECKLCAKSFSLPGNLKIHQVVHTGEKPYECKLCAKSFSLPGHLKTHQVVHTGEKPYACKLCAKSFNVSSNLKSHMRIHTGEKPYTCNTCYKSFSVLGSLKAHHVVHTGEKLYACKLCAKSISWPGHLKRHQVVHTGEKHVN